MGGRCSCGLKCGESEKCASCSVSNERIRIAVWLRTIQAPQDPKVLADLILKGSLDPLPKQPRIWRGPCMTCHGARVMCFPPFTMKSAPCKELDAGKCASTGHFMCLDCVEPVGDAHG